MDMGKLSIHRLVLIMLLLLLLLLQSIARILARETLFCINSMIVHLLHIFCIDMIPCMLIDGDVAILSQCSDVRKHTQPTKTRGSLHLLKACASHLYRSHRPFGRVIVGVYLYFM